VANVPQIKVLRIPLILLGPVLTSTSPKDELTFELYHYPSALGCGKTCSKSFYSGGAARSDCCAVKEYVAKSGSDKRSIKALKCPEGLADIFHVEASLGDDASIPEGGNFDEEACSSGTVGGVSICRHSRVSEQL
jgi:hypothetical protein